MVLCWGEGHGSAIHDHANAHCIMKMLQGKLCEVWKRLSLVIGADRTDIYLKTRRDAIQSIRHIEAQINFPDQIRVAGQVREE